MKKKMSALALAAVMAASAVTPAMAATEYHYIESIHVTLNHSIEAGSDDWEVSVGCSTSGVEFDDYEDVVVTNAPDDGEAWRDDIKPQIKIVLRAETDDDYRFKDIDKEDVTISGAEISKYSVSDSSKKVTITVTLPELEYEEGYWNSVLELEDFNWDDQTAYATWEENENAKYYEYKLYRGSSALTGVEKTEETDLDLAKYFTRGGEYKLKVRAVYDSKKRGAWEEEEIDVDKEEAAEIYANAGYTSSSSSSSTSTNKGPSSGTSASAASLPSYVVKGNWGTKNGKWTFTDNKGVAYKEKWAAVHNPYANTSAGQQAFDWFYFDANGYMVTGWIVDGGRYYYCSPLSDGTQGRMVTGWTKIDGAWYYFNPNSDGTRGTMLVNTWIGNDYVGADGKFEKSR